LKPAVCLGCLPIYLRISCSLSMTRSP